MQQERPLYLRREIGIVGATMMGLGSMIGTGVFVSIGIAVGVAGSAAMPAIVLAAGIATCNALSSAQLAASHPVSGGTYEYGYHYLTPALGFTAGWMFLCAKTASAATAALGFSAYLLRLVDLRLELMPALAVGIVGLFTILVLSGMRRSSSANMLIVSVTLFALLALIVTGLAKSGADGADDLIGLFQIEEALGAEAFLYATALMFVAYTGYARIATLGEEVIEPRRTIPRAIILTLIVTALLYVLVAAVVVASFGSDGFGDFADAQMTSLEAAARATEVPLLPTMVAMGAIAAMLGVLLNLILGLSRVVLAMGRQGDLPPLFARLSSGGSAPPAAVVMVGLLVAALASIGSIETTWAFSAFTVLIYYAITNLAALRLAQSQRLYPKWIAATGLAACLFLAFWVPIPVWVAGVALILVGLIWRTFLPPIWRNE